MRLRKFWGWGYDDELLSSEEENNIDQRIAKTFQLDQVERIEIPKISDIDINKPLFSCLLYTSPSPRDYAASRMPSSA